LGRRWVPISLRKRGGAAKKVSAKWMSVKDNLPTKGYAGLFKARERKPFVGGPKIVKSAGPETLREGQVRRPHGAFEAAGGLTSCLFRNRIGVMNKDRKRKHRKLGDAQLK